MLWHRSFPSTSSLAPHLASSAEGGRAERVIYRTHLFIHQSFPPRNVWHIYLFKCHASHSSPWEQLQQWTILTRFRILWIWFDESRAGPLWRRLQKQLMVVKALNCSHWHPYLGKPPLRVVLPFFSQWMERGGAGNRTSPNPAASFDLLARFTCFGLWSHLYMHSHIFYPAGSQNMCHLTQPLKQLLINNRRAANSPCEEVQDVSFLWQTYGVFFFSHHLT